MEWKQMEGGMEWKQMDEMEEKGGMDWNGRKELLMSLTALKGR
ncbi:hypothetical protein [Anaerobiospirillum sp. NML120449]|nr:hypothetical protein [Anaerobiospirillum sp. NML120449]